MLQEKVIVGVNDLLTLHPEVAAEADGWDPSTVVAKSSKRLSWKCIKGHKWEASVYKRTRVGSVCPVCSNQHKICRGFNDLLTKFPEIAKEADGWDPSYVTPGSSKRLSWKCIKKHKWITTPAQRTGANKSGCPFCANRKVWVRFNDLLTKFPEIAKEADGWDPSTLLAGALKKMPWQCAKGHKWEASVYKRTKKGNRCPFCAGKKLCVGFNDLQSKSPEIAKEADGWDPSTVLFGSKKKMPWKCLKGHTWEAAVDKRTREGTGCRTCAEYGFDPDKPTWFYLMKREGEQQFGITNHIKERIKYHSDRGWSELQTKGPHDGNELEAIEKKLKKWLRKEVGLVKGKTENWYTSKMEVHSLAELKEKSGVETSFF